MRAIYKKEMQSYFNSMIGYIFISFLVLMVAIFFVMNSVLSLSPAFQNALSGTTIVFLIIIPALTMRLFADEAKQKTDQLLFTSPLTITEIVGGKFLAAFSMFALALIITVLFPIMISSFGELPSAQIFAVYIGYGLLGACFIAVGLFISVLTSNQIVAAVGTFGVLFLFFIIDSVASALPTSRVSSIIFVLLLVILLAYVVYDSTKNIFAAIIIFVLGAGFITAQYFLNNLFFDSLIYKFLSWFSVLARFNNFSKGVLNLADIVYYLTFSATFVYLTVNVIEKRRWR